MTTTTLGPTMPTTDLHSYLQLFIKAHTVKTYLEIGTREGDSLKNVVKDNPDLVDVVLSDMWGSDYGGTGRNSHNHISMLLFDLDYNNSIMYLDGDSTKTIPTLVDKYLNYFDLVLVDGDHSYQGAMTDLINVFPLCKSGGHILFHDICHPAHKYLDQCFDEFVNNHNDEIMMSSKLIDELGTGIIIKK